MSSTLVSFPRAWSATHEWSRHRGVAKAAGLDVGAEDPIGRGLWRIQPPASAWIAAGDLTCHQQARVGEGSWPLQMVMQKPPGPGQVRAPDAEGQGRQAVCDPLGPARRPATSWLAFLKAIARSARKPTGHSLWAITWSDAWG